MPEPGESPTNPAPNDDAFADFSDIVGFAGYKTLAVVKTDIKDVVDN